MNDEHSATVGQSDVLAALVTGGPGPRRRTRVGAWIGLAALLLAVVAGAGLAVKSKAAGTAPLLVTEPVTRGTLRLSVEATGNLQPTNQVDVGSELSGTVESVLVEENDRVVKGQALARLDVSKLEDQIRRSEAALVSAEAKRAQADATAREAEANLARLEEVSELSGGKVPSRAEMETAQATLTRARAEQSSARASVSEATAALSTDRINLSKASIRSPIDGIVLSRSVEPGQTVAASLQVATLFTLAEDLKEMELEVAVDEADVGNVRAGQQATFTVDAYPSRVYAAQVTRVAFGSTTSNNVVTYTTTLEVMNEDLSLRPGMTATADIATVVRENVLLVPNAALRFTPQDQDAVPASGGLMRSLMPGPPRGGASGRQGQAASKAGERQVWIVQNGQPTAVTVTVGPTDGRRTEVSGAGVTEGVSVVTDSGRAGQ